MKNQLIALLELLTEDEQKLCLVRIPFTDKVKAMLVTTSLSVKINGKPINDKLGSYGILKSFSGVLHLYHKNRNEELIIKPLLIKEYLAAGKL